MRTFPAGGMLLHLAAQLGDLVPLAFTSRGVEGADVLGALDLGATGVSSGAARQEKEVQTYRCHCEN